MQSGSFDLGARAAAPARCCARALAAEGTPERFFGRTTPRTLMKGRSWSLPVGSRSFSLKGLRKVLPRFQPSNGFSRPSERAPIDALCSQPTPSWPTELVGENKNLIENARAQPSNALSPD